MTSLPPESAAEADLGALLRPSTMSDRRSRHDTRVDSGCHSRLLENWMTAVHTHKLNTRNNIEIKSIATSRHCNTGRTYYKSYTSLSVHVGQKITKKHVRRKSENPQFEIFRTLEWRHLAAQRKIRAVLRI